MLSRRRRRSGPKDLSPLAAATAAPGEKKNAVGYPLLTSSLLHLHAVFFSAWEPSRKPFLARRGRSLRWRMRPVPVVLRRMALLAQLSVFFYVYVFVLEVVGVEEKER